MRSLSYPLYRLAKIIKLIRISALLFDFYANREGLHSENGAYSKQTIGNPNRNVSPCVHSTLRKCGNRFSSRLYKTATPE